MALIRGHHEFDSQFTQIPNDWLRDARLSWKATGLLAHIMSHSPGWKMSIRSLAKQRGCGQDTVKTGLQELEALGYLKRSKQKHDENGHFGDFDYITQNPWPDFTVSGFHRVGKTGHKEDYLLREEQSFKDNKRIYPQKSKFEEFWTAYPRKVSKGEARKAYAKAIEKTNEETLIAKAKAYAKQPGRKDEFTKYPASWLNAEGWLDEYESDFDELRELRRQKELDQTQKMLAEQDKPYREIPKCEHGSNPALCKECLKRLK